MAFALLIGAAPPPIGAAPGTPLLICADDGPPPLCALLGIVPPLAVLGELLVLELHMASDVAQANARPLSMQSNVI